MSAHANTFSTGTLPRHLAPAPATPAPARFPYDHATVEQTDTRDPAAWHAANRARFDAIHAPRTTAARIAAARIAAARKWRADMKPHFDALYGP